MSSFAPDTLMLLQVPQQIEEPYSEFHPNWIYFVEQNHGNVLKLVKLRPMGHAPDGVLSEMWLDGWDVTHPGYKQNSAYFPLRGECASWVPSEWLVPIPFNFPCDCETQQLLTKGCQISWHK